MYMHVHVHIYLGLVNVSGSAEIQPSETLQLQGLLQNTVYVNEGTVVN